MNRRNFIKFTSLCGAAAVGAGARALIDSSSSAGEATAEFVVKIHLPPNVNFNEYISIRNKKMNYKLFTEIENDFLKKGKIISKNFVFADQVASLTYLFKSAGIRSEYVSLLQKGFPASSFLKSESSLELTFQNS